MKENHTNVKVVEKSKIKLTREQEIFYIDFYCGRLLEFIDKSISRNYERKNHCTNCN